MEHLPPNIEGNLAVWGHLAGVRQYSFHLKRGSGTYGSLMKRSSENNVFHVTDEFVFTNGSKKIRPDVVFLINGVPFLLVETKAAHKLEGIAESLGRSSDMNANVLSFWRYCSFSHSPTSYNSTIVQPGTPPSKVCSIGRKRQRATSRP